MTDNGAARAVSHGGDGADDAAHAAPEHPRPAGATHDTSRETSRGTEKTALRTALRAGRRRRRDATDVAARAAQGDALLDALRPLLDRASCVASFEPMPTESNLGPVNAHVLATGRLLVPITLDDLDLSWRDAATGADLGRDAIANADLVIAPALAIGPHGERLGQGGGCYDRALPRRTPGTPVVAVVFANEDGFPHEMGVDVPTEPHDERVDGVVTVHGLTRFTDLLKS